MTAGRSRHTPGHPDGARVLFFVPAQVLEKSCLRAAARNPINAIVIHSSNLRRSNSVAKMASVKGAWCITRARREEEKADTN